MILSLCFSRFCLQLISFQRFCSGSPANSMIPEDHRRRGISIPDAAASRFAVARPGDQHTLTSEN